MTEKDQSKTHVMKKYQYVIICGCVMTVMSLEDATAAHRAIAAARGAREAAQRRGSQGKSIERPGAY